MPTNGFFLPFTYNPMQFSIYQDNSTVSDIPAGPLYVTDNGIYLVTDDGEYLAPDD